MMSLVWEHGRQCMPCSAKFSMTLQTEIRQIIISSHLILNSVLYILFCEGPCYGLLCDNGLDKTCVSRAPVQADLSVYCSQMA